MESTLRPGDPHFSNSNGPLLRPQEGFVEVTVPTSPPCCTDARWLLCEGRVHLGTHTGFKAPVKTSCSAVTTKSPRRVPKLILPALF